MKSLAGVAVKINIYTGSYVEDVIYYRYNLPLELVQRWKWYFEYLTALVKVHNPKRKVELIICAQHTTICGKDYIGEHIRTFLRAKKIQLKKAITGRYEDDLFGFEKAKHDSKIQFLQEEIEALERGEFRYYVPPTEINKIKEYIKK